MADKILHNLPIDNNPSDSVKIAMGTETTPATNITLANFYTLLMSKLGFFKVSNYLSEVVGNLTAMAAVRNNIDVYSRGYTDMMISSKANKTNVIEKDSTVAFTPTIGTHPVNKKYVDDRFRFGAFVFGDIPDPAVFKTVTFSPAFSDNNFIVLIEMNSLNGEVSSAYVSPDTKTPNSFKVGFVEDPVGAGQNVAFSYTCIHR